MLKLSKHTRASINLGQLLIPIKTIRKVDVFMKGILSMSEIMAWIKLQVNSRMIGKKGNGHIRVEVL